MSYTIIQPPFTLIFREMSKQELKDYNIWFHNIMNERIDILTEIVKSTHGYEFWEPNYSPDSLNLLGQWFFTQADARPRTQDEIAGIHGRSEFKMHVPGEELTNRSFSLAIDIGMYVSRVFLTNHPSLRWSQLFGNKKSIDYGRPVLMGFRTGPFNPVHMMVTLAYGLVSKTKDGGSLRNIYNIWSSMIDASLSTKQE